MSGELLRRWPLAHVEGNAALTSQRAHKCIKSPERLPLLSTSGQPRCEEATTTKKKKTPPLWLRVCARKRKGPETSPAPQSALHLCAGLQWIQPTVPDYIYNTGCEGGASHSAERVSRVRLFEGAQHKAKSLSGSVSLSLSLSLSLPLPPHPSLLLFALFLHW